MKKGVSILLTAMMWLSEVSFSFAIHDCGGKVAAIKISLSGEKASCGMHVHPYENPWDELQVSGICDDHISIYSVEDNYMPSKNVNKIIVKAFSQLIYSPALNSSDKISHSKYTALNAGEPAEKPPGSVELEKICILRI